MLLSLVRIQTHIKFSVKTYLNADYLDEEIK